MYLSTPQFAPPSKDVYHFGLIYAELVRELERRHFEAPGVDVELRVDGSGEARTFKVSKIAAGDTWVRDGFGFDVTWRHEQLAVYSDGGARYKAYVGDDWERDRLEFTRDYGVDSKLKGKPRTYLIYRGSAERGRCTYRGKPCAYLVHTNDLDREYDLHEGDPATLVVSEVVERARAAIREIIELVKQAPVKQGAFAYEEDEPVPFTSEQVSLVESTR